MTDKLIEDRLAASLRFDAFNGNSMERSIAIGQAREAEQELRRLRATRAPMAEWASLQELNDAIAVVADKTGAPASSIRVTYGGPEDAQPWRMTIDHSGAGRSRIIGHGYTLQQAAHHAVIGYRSSRSKEAR